jgi:hypothetical protein
MEYVALTVFWAGCDICLRRSASVANTVSGYKVDTVLPFRSFNIALRSDKQTTMYKGWCLMSVSGGLV